MVSPRRWSHSNSFAEKQKEEVVVGGGKSALPNTSLIRAHSQSLLM